MRADGTRGVAATLIRALSLMGEGGRRGATELRRRPRAVAGARFSTGRPSPSPFPTGKGSKIGRDFEDAGEFCKGLPEGRVGERRGHAGFLDRGWGQRDAPLYTIRLQRASGRRAWRRCVGGRLPGPRMCQLRQADVSSFSGDVSTLAGDLSTLAGDLSSFSGDVFTFPANVFTFPPNVFSFPSDVFSFRGHVFSFRRRAP